VGAWLSRGWHAVNDLVDDFARTGLILWCYEDQMFYYTPKEPQNLLSGNSRSGRSIQFQAGGTLTRVLLCHASEVRRVVGIAGTFIVWLLRVRAQRPAQFHFCIRPAAFQL
jgi:hypothetical protein